MDTKELYRLFLECNSISTDTRKISPNNMFFALKGDNFNGNKFALQALEAGAKYSIVDEYDHYDNSSIIKVDNVLESLQKLATYHREVLNIPIIAITGSNGKTTTKELLYSVLSQKFNTIATVGNLNNHIGVPLTLLSIKTQHDIAIIEMGANHQKEIEQLCEIAKPNFGLITNIGKAHLEGFGGEEGVFKGKTEMFLHIQHNNGIFFLNVDDKKLETLRHKENIIPYGLNSDELRAEIIKVAPNLGIRIQHKDIVYEIYSQLTGIYNTSNILSAIAIGIYFKIPIELIKKGIEQYLPTNNRSQIKNENGIMFILDAYNANPSSMEVALQNLHEMEGKKKIAVLGNMLELGEFSRTEHEKIIQQIKTYSIEAMLVGEGFKGLGTHHYPVFSTSEEAGAELSKRSLQGYIILLKGSRGSKMENILPYLNQQVS